MCRVLIIRLLLILLLVYTGDNKAQQLIFFKPENLKQLPSSETYNVMQDSQGFIWFSTEGGLCRYNGDNLKIFDSRSGLSEAATYNVKERNNEIWVTTSKSRLFKYAQGKFTEPSISKDIQEGFFAKYKYNISQMSWINDSVMILSSQRNTNMIVNVRSNKITYHEHEKDPNDFYFRIFDNAAFVVQVPFSRSSVVYAAEKKALGLVVEMNGKIFRYSVPYSNPYFPSWRCYVVQDKQGRTWIGLDDRILEIDATGKEKMHVMPNTILSMSLDKNDGLWVGTLYSGVHYFPHSVMGEEFTALPEMSVTGVCEDKEGGTWCTTLEKGIFYCRNRAVIDYSNRAEFKKISLLKFLDGHLFISSAMEKLGDLYRGKFITHTIENGNLLFADIARYQNAWILCSNNFVGILDSSFRLTRTIEYAPNLNVGARQVVQAAYDSVYALTYGAVLVVHPGGFGQLKKNAAPDRCIFLAKNHTLYAGGQNGLFYYHDSSWHKIPGVNSTVTKMIETHNGRIWIATKEGGIFELNKGRVANLEKILTLKTRRFSDITEDRFGNIWLASNIGVVKIIPKENGYASFYYNTLSGLPSDEIYKVAATDSSLYVSTPEGMCSFPLNEELANNVLPAVRLEELRVTGRLRTCNERLTVPYDSNTVKLKLDVFTFKRAGVAPTIIYIVKGDGVNQQSIRSNELVLNNLSPGNYVVFVYGLNNDNRLSEKPLVLNIEVRKPWWQSWFFLIPVFLLFLFGVFVVTRLIIRRVRLREQEKTRINKMLAEYHMSALRAQMNPHFIFNCINSIQRYILTKKSQEAYNYLTKFSRLIRLVLNYAEKNLITLSQELEIVELYTELEQLRFDNKFTYQFRIAGSVHPDELYVPVLIIQPYIENAIWHGIMNLDKDKTGHISITILLENNVLEIIVEDNGVGRARAAAFSKKDHESKATWINNKRAEIINMTGSNVQNVFIEDILAIDRSVAGTRVTIRITQNPKTHEQDQLRHS